MGIKLDAIGIFVKDLKVMIEFYRDVLGIDIDWDGNGPFAEFKHDGIRLMMYERKELNGFLGKEVSYPDGNLIEIGSWGKGEK